MHMERSVHRLFGGVWCCCWWMRKWCKVKLREILRDIFTLGGFHLAKVLPSGILWNMLWSFTSFELEAFPINRNHRTLPDGERRDEHEAESDLWLQRAPPHRQRQFNFIWFYTSSSSYLWAHRADGRCVRACCPVATATQTNRVTRQHASTGNH